MKRLRNSVVKWLVLSLLCLLLGFLLGKFKQDILENKLSVMAVDLETMQTRNARLETELSQVKIISASDLQTIKSLVESYKLLQDELAVVNNKLYFYEGVISPEIETTGVRVHSFEITKNNQKNDWDYEVVLMQSQKGRRFLKGKIDISLSIFEDEELKKVPLSELNKEVTGNFKFKYFQTIKGTFSTPKGVTIDEVIVQLNVAGSRWHKAQSVETRYDWRVLATQDTGDLSEFDSIDGASNENSTAPQ